MFGHPDHCAVELSLSVLTSMLLELSLSVLASTRLVAHSATDIDQNPFTSDCSSCSRAHLHHDPEDRKHLQVSFKHVATGIFLASHDRKYGRPIAGQQEVCGKMKLDTWTATEGVYFPQRT